jgi:maltose alpha-D-glucosyltransferase/alpha-amylase
MADNIWLDDRNGVRTPMQWEPGPTAGFSQAHAKSLYAPVINHNGYSPEQINVHNQRADLNSLWNVIRRMISVRKQHRAFSWGEFEWIDFQNNAVAVFQRSYNNETILAVHSLSDTKQRILYPIKKSVRAMTDLLTEEEFVPRKEHLEIELGPYQYLWLK